MSQIGQRASAFAPASSGNVSVGFDLLGAALLRIDGGELGDRVNVEFAEQDELTNSGEYAHVCPDDAEQNLAWQAYRLFRSKLANDSFPKVKMELVKSLPVGSGLGSSACSVVASLTALNRLFGHYFSDNDMLLMMGEIEAAASGDLHYDNVAPSYFGGLQLMSPSSDEPVLDLPIPDQWYVVVAFPGFAFPTKQAREVLPKQYDKHDVIANAQNLSVFITQLFKGQQVKAAQAIKDVVAEPFRGKLIKGFVSARNALVEQGALAVGISGAGPTLFAVTTELAEAKNYEQYLNEHYLQSENGFAHICRIAPQGAKHLD
ncbi:homoserine kinase [Psychrosphaera sp. B3R10]|uniref:homoserine kinase n=1 Tax=unclassified Psychrosphaera TaxID=2641570 RepID=UPI001C08B42A|nr:homoserine kinase [Psychrosphaera sp. I2R16]MBU2991375.1 homoserine kinase [Psychrosphaera sp. B3R10]